MDLNDWAKNLTKTVFNEWKSKYEFWKPGFKVFYSPVSLNPRLMIISYNPGGDETSFAQELARFSKGDFSVPKVNSYVEKPYPMAKRMRDFFEGHSNLLRDSVVFPILFFRSESEKYWKRIVDKKTRNDMEVFCYAKVKEIVQTVKPKALLVLGFGTYRLLKKHVLSELDKEQWYVTKVGRRISCKAKWNGLPIFCILHPTGGRITRDDRDRNKKLFFSSS